MRMGNPRGPAAKTIRTKLMIGTPIRFFLVLVERPITLSGAVRSQLTFPNIKQSFIRSPLTIMLKSL